MIVSQILRRCQAVKPRQEFPQKFLPSVHPETMSLDVILRSPANGGTTKNLIVILAAEILRSAQNDIGEFPDGHYLKITG